MMKLMINYRVLRQLATIGSFPTISSVSGCYAGEKIGVPV